MLPGYSAHSTIGVKFPTLLTPNLYTSGNGFQWVGPSAPRTESVGFPSRTQEFVRQEQMSRGWFPEFECVDDPGPSVLFVFCHDPYSVVSHRPKPRLDPSFRGRFSPPADGYLCTRVEKATRSPSTFGLTHPLLGTNFDPSLVRGTECGH